MQWPSYWADLVDVSQVSVSVKKKDTTPDKSCEDCNKDLVEATQQWGGVIQVALNDVMVATNTYIVKITNVITPLDDQKWQHFTVFTGTSDKFTSISNLGMADSSFDTGPFTPPKNKVTVFTFCREGKETDTFPVWKNVYGNKICFRAVRGFRKPGSLTLDNDNF